MARMFGYEVAFDPNAFRVVESAVGVSPTGGSRSYSGDDLAILEDQDGVQWEFMNGQLFPLLDGAYTMFEPDDRTVRDGRWVKAPWVPS